ncbi:VanZ family protein [Flavobacteriaceae bacterium 14752]|uniref:VanZ family protein n=1 Tax=Mesohalobacter salilacus TaxID=2491711 RepID=UPI000F63C399|nr:VanZ family protein [Flavobacteriaceae bacterium 14752]
MKHQTFYLQMTIKNILKDKTLSFSVAVIYSLAILILSLINLESSPIKIETSDKVYHFVSYTLMAIFWLWFLKTTRNKTSYTSVSLIILSIIVYGIIIEYLQLNLTNYRMFDWNDVKANVFGTIFGYLIFFIASRILFSYKFDN